MIVLTIRTESAQAEICIYKDETLLDQHRWEAHRQLAGTLLSQINELLTKHRLGWHSISGIICYQGPGSFTGLRIGLSVGNALAYTLNIPIVACQQNNWIDKGLKKLETTTTIQSVLPEYGAPPHITISKH